MIPYQVEYHMCVITLLLQDNNHKTFIQCFWLRINKARHREWNTESRKNKHQQRTINNNKLTYWKK